MISNADKIEKLVDSMDQEAKRIKAEILKLCWYMRGGITYTEAMNMSMDEREALGSIIKENLKTTKESGLPFF